MLGPHPDHGRDEHPPGAGLQAAGADGAADLAGQGGQVGPGGVGGGEQDAGVLGQQPAGVGEPDTAALSSSRTPTSFSSTVSCWEIADGV
jgi:hypothetical protein